MEVVYTHTAAELPIKIFESAARSLKLSLAQVVGH